MDVPETFNDRQIKQSILIMYNKNKYTRNVHLNLKNIFCKNFRIYNNGI